MTGDLLDLILRAARAIDTTATANEFQQAADETHGTPEAAASAHWDAASLCRQVGERFTILAERHTFAAKRMEAEQRRENVTGIEYRAGGDAA